METHFRIYDFGVKLAGIVIGALVFGFLFQVGWNAFIWEFLGLGSEMGYKAGVGFSVLMLLLYFTVQMFRSESIINNTHIHYDEKSVGDMFLKEEE